MRIPSLTAHTRLAVLLMSALLAGCATQPATSDAEKIDRVLRLVGQRLAYMDDVARNKWNSGAPIEDLPREREIIDSIGRQAPDYGLDAAIAKEFFRAQIEASKAIQRARFDEWRAIKQPPFEKPTDLRDYIRPALDALTPELMKALAAAMPALQAADSAALIKNRAAVIAANGTDNAAARDIAIAPLMLSPGRR